MTVSTAAEDEEDDLSLSTETAFANHAFVPTVSSAEKRQARKHHVHSTAAPMGPPPFLLLDPPSDATSTVMMIPVSWDEDHLFRPMDAQEMEALFDDE